ncbi:MAG TPA: M14 family metallopeptidase [Gemmatimonadales bacterium]|nr:M14 family metallopeptidase [Gemmatimonadales bacterium]
MIVLVLGAVLAQQPFAVGPVTALPGQRASGFIEIPAAADSGTRVPITILRGAEAGPTLALIAGTHGSEVAPILALHRLRSELDPGRLRGTVILVHVANLPSFLGRTIYYSPIDRRNLNRVYPGRPDGTVSERIAYAITREVIERADYVVDMHAGDGNESLRPYTYWMPLGLDARVDSIALDMALAFGHDHIVIDTMRERNPAASVYTSNTAMTRGRPAITTETGWLGEPNEEMVRRNVVGVNRLLRYLRMLPGPVEMVRRPVWLARTEVLRSSVTGVWHAAVQRGQRVDSGAVIGHTTDLFGEQRTEVRAPFAGIVLYVVATPAMNAGEPLAMVGMPSSRPPR